MQKVVSSNRDQPLHSLMVHSRPREFGEGSWWKLEISLGAQEFSRVFWIQIQRW